MPSVTNVSTTLAPWAGSQHADERECRDGVDVLSGAELEVACHGSRLRPPEPRRDVSDSSSCGHGYSLVQGVFSAVTTPSKTRYEKLQARWRIDTRLSSRGARLSVTATGVGRWQQV